MNDTAVRRHVVRGRVRYTLDVEGVTLHASSPEVLAARWATRVDGDQDELLTRIRADLDEQRTQLLAPIREANAAYEAATTAEAKRNAKVERHSAIAKALDGGVTKTEIAAAGLASRGTLQRWQAEGKL